MLPLVPRSIGPLVLRSAATFPAVGIVGPRQSGKSSLVRSLFPGHKLAVMESPEMPNTSAGIQAPDSALLLAAPLSTTPSGWPVPNFSGSFENFFDIAYDIQAAMSAPAPGSAPISVPRLLPRSACSGYFFTSAHCPLKMLPNFSCARWRGRSTDVT